MGRWKDKTHQFRHVTLLPARPGANARYWLESTRPEGNHTHCLFKYPAKFHRPVVRWALSAYAKPGGVVLDPYTGSGTLQVEALIQKISSVGVDIDPLACFVARAKTTPINPDLLDKRLENLQKRLEKVTRSQTQLEKLIGSDISRSQFTEESRNVWIPTIPNIEHWFRRHVIVDLARLLASIKGARLTDAERTFFLACFAAVIRRVSNADPTPVSGLEVTSLQAERNKHREINTFEEFLHRARTSIDGMRELWDVCRRQRSSATAIVIRADARDMEPALAAEVPQFLPFSLVVTSPPYCNAVEYSRRHKLEMFWLSLVSDQASHQEVSRQYVGNSHGMGRPEAVLRNFGITQIDALLQKILRLDKKRAISLERYFAAMDKFFCELGRITKKGATVVCVIGNSTCCGIEVPTAGLAPLLAWEHFRLRRKFSYAIQNHYMQYGLRNGKGIREESVLLFEHH